MSEQDQIIQAVAQAISDDGVNWENRMIGPRKRLWLRRAAIAVEMISSRIKDGTYSLHSEYHAQSAIDTNQTDGGK